MMEAHRTRGDAVTREDTASRHTDREGTATEVQKVHEERSREVMEASVVTGSSCLDGSCHRVLRLLAYLCILIFVPSISRCAGPLRSFIQHSPAFLNQGETSKEEKLQQLADAFAVCGSSGLLGGLALSTVFASWTSPKILGLLCVAAAACGLLISVTAQSTATLRLGLFFLALTCATTNAVLPIVACFRNPAAVFTTICATDFASVIPLQALQFLAEYYALDLCRVICVYVVMVYPVLLLTVILCIPSQSFPVAGADFYKPLDTTEQLKENAKDHRDGTQYTNDSQGCRLQKRQEDKCEAPEGGIVRKHSPSRIHQTPPLWNLSLEQQLRSADIYGISIWWFAVSMGMECLRLYMEQSIVIQAGDNEQHTVVAANRTLLQKTLTWSAPCLVLVLPSLYCVHLGQIRLRMTKSTVRMSADGLGLFASILLALAGLLFTAPRPLLCATGVLVGQAVQALAPTAMFIMLTNAYGLKRLSLFQTIEIILLATVGFLMPVLRPWLTENIKLLQHVMLTSAVISFLALTCPRCRRPPLGRSNPLHVLATGIPLAVERSSMAAVFSQAGFPCKEEDITAEEPPGGMYQPNEEEQRTLLLSEESNIEQC